MNSTTAALNELLKLPFDERFEAAQLLWSSIADDVNEGRVELPIPDSVLEELHRRTSQLDSGEVKLVPWEEVKKALAHKRK